MKAGKRSCRDLVAGAFAVATAFAAADAAAAIDMFLKIDGVPGESIAKGHANEIDVLAWSWGALGALPRVAQTPGQSFCAQALSVTKFVDLATGPLLAKAATGEVIPKTRLTVVRAGASPIAYLIIDLTNVRVSSESTGGSGGEDRLTESVTLSFSAATLTYTPQNPDGSAGTPNVANVSPGCL